MAGRLRGRVRRSNQELTDQLATAVAQIQRLSVQNHRLQQELEAASGVIAFPAASGRTTGRGE